MWKKIVVVAGIKVAYFLTGERSGRLRLGLTYIFQLQYHNVTLPRQYVVLPSGARTTLRAVLSTCVPR